MSRPECIDCKFFGDDVVNGYKVGVCKRYAPRRVSGVGTGSNDQRFPIVGTDDWCGEFEYDTNKSYFKVPMENEENQ